MGEQPEVYNEREKKAEFSLPSWMVRMFRFSLLIQEVQSFLVDRKEAQSFLDDSVSLVDCEEVQFSWRLHIQ